MEVKSTNRLANEKSPYLLQHAHNPVDWYPWSEESFEKAEELDRPIFLSIGYSTCHWCHVMERESFEDREVAKLLNEHFVSVKVDREERPDVDHIYMTVCQAMTGRGGWPLTVIMTPDRKPFYAGTYFPKESKHGLPGLMDVLRTVTRKWEGNRAEIDRISDSIVDSIEPHLHTSRKGDLQEPVLHEGYQVLRDSFDGQYGGFGQAPKFPTPHNLGFLLRYWRWTGEEQALAMVEKTLQSMHDGGIYDHLGYGFSRYSVDREWLVPHFEKMLYDNALLATAYLECYQATGDEGYGRVADEIFQYVLRDMTSSEGGFYSAEDADSEGEEGKFYVWSPAEIREALGEEMGDRFCQWYGVTEEGNFEGKNILNRIGRDAEGADSREWQEELEQARVRLLATRDERVRPHKDDKILTSWNALMITALARGSRILGNKDYLDSAVRAARFIWSQLRDDRGRLMARYRDGESAHLGYVDDYAFLIRSLLDLYDADMKPIWLERAIHLQDEQDRLFWDDEAGGYFFYGTDAEELLARPKMFHDGAVPSGNSVSALNLFHLGRLTAEEAYGSRGEQLLESFSGEISRQPAGYGHALSATLFALFPGREVVVASERDPNEVRRELEPLARTFAPEVTLLYRLRGDGYSGLEALALFTQAMKADGGETTFYVCHDHACQQPTRELSEVLAGLGTGPGA